MEFKDAKEVKSTLAAGEETRRVRSENRAKVDNAISGFAYLTLAESKAQGCPINPNFGEIVELAAHARRQYDQALLGPQYFFKVKLRKGPEEHRTHWSEVITEEINRIMKGSEEYACLNEYQFGAVVAHGIGPEHWCDQDAWLGEFVSIDDFIVPLDTLTSFKGQEWIGVRKPWTEGDLSDMVFGENASKKWNKKAIQKILDAYHNLNTENSGINWMNQPEKMADLIKQSGGFYTSDAVPTIPLVNFYYRVHKKGKKPYWKMVVVPDYEMGCMGAIDTEEFLFDSGDKPVADNIEQLLCVQFGDLNSKAPYKFHAVRSLGMLLFEPCFWKNFTFCQQLNHLLQSFKPWIKVTDPGGKARAQNVDFSGTGVVPEGISIVPQTERHQVNHAFAESVIAQLKQFLSERSSSYTQNLDTGTSKEQTAFEVQTKLTQVNAILTGLLGRAFRKKKISYTEICRRFCRENSKDEDVKAFQAACKKEGISKEYLNIKLWDIEPEIPIGGGNQTMAMAIAQQFMSVRAMLDPDSQRIVLHEFIEATGNNSKMADLLVPLLLKPKLTSAEEYATTIFPALMLAVPVEPKQGLAIQPQIETLLPMLAAVIQTMSLNTNMQGVQTVFQFIGGLIQQLGQDQSQGEKVAEYQQVLQALMQQASEGAKAIEKAKQNGNISPEVQAKAAAIAAESQLKMKIDSESHQADLARSSEEFRMRAQQEKQIEDLDKQIKLAEARLTLAKAEAEVAAINLKAQTEARATQLKTEATIDAVEAKTEADIEAKRKMATTSAKAAESQPEPSNTPAA